MQLILHRTVLLLSLIHILYHEEGSYVEYTVNADGEFMVKKQATDFKNVAEFDNPAYKDAISGDWQGESNRITMKSDDGLNDVYRITADAVIYLVESDAYGDYKFESAQALNYDEFRQLGDFLSLIHI